jgi:hypothetical protein
MKMHKKTHKISPGSDSDLSISTFKKEVLLMRTAFVLLFLLSFSFNFPDVRGSDLLAMTMTGEPLPSSLDLSATRFSANKIFKVSFTSKLQPIVINKMHSWELKVETPDGLPVPGAQIAIDGGMPQHGHGLPTEPAVTQELGDGRYLVEGLKFSMPGWWVVNFHIGAENKQDSVTFNLLLK